jgi:hypothetical protein
MQMTLFHRNYLRKDARWSDKGVNFLLFLLSLALGPRIILFQCTREKCAVARPFIVSLIDSFTYLMLLCLI